MASLPALVVVTGGPFSGKTTMVRALQSRGFEIIPEAAMVVIRRLNDQLGPEGQRRWRRSHLPEFQDMVLEMQLQRESALEADAGPVILDRGVADGIAYFRHHGRRPPDHLVEAARARPYVHAFVLQTLEHFDSRSSSGRTSSREDSLRIGEMLATAYDELAVPVTRVECMPLDRRVERVASLLKGLALV